MNTPFLENEHFYMRELRESDLDGHWYAWFNDSLVTQFQNKKIFPNTREKQRAYFDSIQNSDTDVVLAIIDKHTEQHFGNVGLHRIDWVHRSAELGIVIGEMDFWGKGYGKEAWRLITEYGFHVLNLHRIWAIVMSGNEASAKCAEAAGFRREGHFREMFYKNGTYLDAFYYNMLKSDLDR